MRVSGVDDEGAPPSPHRFDAPRSVREQRQASASGVPIQSRCGTEWRSWVAWRSGDDSIRNANWNA
jgi:hypothetical protein